MKKILLLFTLLLAFTAPSMADYYLLENNSGTWKPGADGKTAMALLPGTTDTYYMDVNPGNDGKWYFIADGDGTSEDDFKANHRYAFSSEQNFTAGCENQELSKHASNNFVINNSYPNPKNNYRIMVKEGEGGSLSLTVKKMDFYVVAGAIKIEGTEQEKFLDGTTSKWNKEDVNNSMTILPGSTSIYIKTYKNVTFSQSCTVEYKVIKNNDWNQATSGDNRYFNVPEGTYDITFLLKDNVNTIAAIYQAQLRGDWNGTDWTAPVDLDYDGETTCTGVLDLSNDVTDHEFKLCISNSDWFGQEGMTINAPSGWVTNGSSTNLKFNNSTTGYKTYDVTATWDGGWTLTIAGKDERIAEINSVVITSGETSKPLTGSNNVYQYANIDFSAITTDIPFILSVNGNPIFDGVTIDPLSTSLLEKGTGLLNGYFIFKNSTSGYKSYDATAIWTPNASATSGWTLKVVGKDLRDDLYLISGPYDDNFTATWSVSESPISPVEGVYTATLSNKPKYMFAFAPLSALNEGKTAVKDDGWGQIIRPVTGDHYLVEFKSYSGTTTTSSAADAKVWRTDPTNDADITINFTPGTSSFTISNVKTKDLSANGYATYSNTYDYKVSGATVNTITSAATTIEMNSLAEGHIIPGGTGVLLEGDGIATITPRALDETATEVGDNLLVGSNNYGYNLPGSYSESTIYLLSKGKYGVGFYKWNGDTSNNALGANLAFLAVPATSREFLGFGEEGGTTGVEELKNSNTEELKSYFNLAGQRVAQPTKGLYIVNGKKVVIK